MSPRQRQEPIDGFPPATHVTFTGTGTNLDGLTVLLGQEVEVSMKGTVTMTGTESVGDAGETRPVVKIKASTVVIR